MDLTIKTRDFDISLNTWELGFVLIFFVDKLYTFVSEGDYYLTRKEVQQLVEYLDEDLVRYFGEAHAEQKERIYYDLSRMHMLMGKDEKALFRFW